MGAAQAQRGHWQGMRPLRLRIARSSRKEPAPKSMTSTSMPREPLISVHRQQPPLAQQVTRASPPLKTWRTRNRRPAKSWAWSKLETRCTLPLTRGGSSTAGSSLPREPRGRTRAEPLSRPTATQVQPLASDSNPGAPWHRLAPSLKIYQRCQTPPTLIRAARPSIRQAQKVPGEIAKCRLACPDTT